MKKNAVLCLAVFLCLNGTILGRDIELGLRGKGIHVAHLSGEDKVTLQINRLEQAVREQNIGAIVRIVSPDYLENGFSFGERQLTETLEHSFADFANTRRFSTEVNEKSGWMITATQDFYIRIGQMRINQYEARVECDVGFLLTSNHTSKETLTFSMVDSIWLLCQSEGVFRFIETASRELDDSPHFADALGSFPIISFTEEDFVSSDMVCPTPLYNSGGYFIPRMNMSTSQQQWGFRHKFIQPFGILADVEICQGGPDFNHTYLFITDPMANNFVASDQDNWFGDYGEWGSGVGQFASPYGMCTIEGYYYFVADRFNHRVVAYEYYNQLDEPLWVDDLTLYCYFNNPVDVEAKERMPDSLQQRTYIAIADAGNDRIVIFRWRPYFGWDRNYGERGSGVGQFIWPSSVCFGRDPNWGWQTNDLFICDNGNHRLVRIYIGAESTIWRSSYQFPNDVDLTSVEVDNKGLVYVLDRHNGKVYKFAPSQDYPYSFKLLGIWGETGTGDGQLDHPNSIQVAHGRYVPYPNPWIPLNNLGDVFITESWGDQTGVRRFVIAADVLNLTAEWVPYNESTGEGNFIWWQYHLTDFGTVTEQVLRGGEVCTTYNEGTLNWGTQAGSWPVGGHPHATNYTVKITAGSIYDPTIVIEKTVEVYVDTISTHNPVITQGLGCHWLNDPFSFCDECWHCIKENDGYTINVQAFHPDGFPLSYEWRCGRGYFVGYDQTICNPCLTDSNEICYVSPEAPGGKPPVYEFIEVIISDPYGGETDDHEYPEIFDSEYSCLCGDSKWDGVVNLSDALYLQSYLFGSGPPPPDPIERADANNNCLIDLGDVVYILNYLFKSGPPPRCCWLRE